MFIKALLLSFHIPHQFKLQLSFSLPNCLTPVVGLVGVELTFPTAAFIVLCFALVARRVLISHQCFACCLLLRVVSIALRLSFQHPPQRQGVDKSWRREIDYLNWPKGHTIWHHAQQYKMREVEEVETLILKTLVFTRNHYMYWSPASQEVAEHCLLMRSTECFFLPYASMLLFFFFLTQLIFFFPDAAD